MIRLPENPFGASVSKAADNALRLYVELVSGKAGLTPVCDKES
jgi:hypothetical protein